MTFPDTVGFQAHSETSKDAMKQLDADNLRGRVLRYLIDVKQGLTCDDISICMSIEQSTIGARLRELELKGRVIKTAMKGTTRHKRKAFVYVVTENWQEHMGKAPVKPSKPKDIVMLEAEHAKMKIALEAWLKYDAVKVSEEFAPLYNEALTLTKKVLGHDV